MYGGQLGHASPWRKTPKRPLTFLSGRSTLVFTFWAAGTMNAELYLIKKLFQLLLRFHYLLPVFNLFIFDMLLLQPVKTTQVTQPALQHRTCAQPNTRGPKPPDCLMFRQDSQLVIGFLAYKINNTHFRPETGFGDSIIILKIILNVFFWNSFYFLKFIFIL